jgi:hypothetical protein
MAAGNGPNERDQPSDSWRRRDDKPSPAREGNLSFRRADEDVRLAR